MPGKQWFILISIALAGAQMACTFSTATVPAETRSGGCPAETTDIKLLKNEEDGYCLLYPADDTLLPPRFIVINPVNAPGIRWERAGWTSRQKLPMHAQLHKQRMLRSHPWAQVSISVVTK
jgi:hypothetical protein